MDTTLTSFEANRRAVAAVKSLEPSSTTMISLRGQVCARADRIVVAIHSSELYAGIRIETRDVFIYVTAGIPNTLLWTSRRRSDPTMRLSLLPTFDHIITMIECAEAQVARSILRSPGEKDRAVQHR